MKLFGLGATVGSTSEANCCRCSGVTPAHAAQKTTHNAAAMVNFMFPPQVDRTPACSEIEPQPSRAPKAKGRRFPSALSSVSIVARELLEDLRHDARTDRAAAFAD